MSLMRDHANKRTWVLLCVIGILTFSSVMLAASALSAKQNNKKAVRSSRSAVLNLQDIDPVMLKKKLNEIYSNQEKILDRFQAILDAIQIVKIRATIR